MREDERCKFKCPADVCEVCVVQAVVRRYREMCMMGRVRHDEYNWLEEYRVVRKKRRMDRNSRVGVRKVG